MCIWAALEGTAPAFVLARDLPPLERFCTLMDALEEPLGETPADEAVLADTSSPTDNDVSSKSSNKNRDFIRFPISVEIIVFERIR